MKRSTEGSTTLDTEERLFAIEKQLAAHAETIAEQSKTIAAQGRDQQHLRAAWLEHASNATKALATAEAALTTARDGLALVRTVFVLRDEEPKEAAK